jgi:phospholipid transport system substrate-binding protein
VTISISRNASLVGILLIGLAFGAARAAPEERLETEARGSVERLYTALIDAMKGGHGYAGRYARLGPVLEDVYDFPFLAEKSLGRHWRRLSEEERLGWVDTFSRLTISIYADRFDRYSGERFEVVGSEPMPHETFLVGTRLVQSNGESVRLNYRMRQRDGRWRIIDVYLNGTVSELALRRSEYSSVVKRDGFQSLVEALEEKIATAERSADPPSR